MIALVVIFAAFAIASVVFQLSRGNTLLDQWAGENGFRIIRSERRSMFRGSFSWTSSKGQEVYYVTVEDKDGKQRSGYVRVGSFGLGVLSDKTEVRWDD